MNVDRAIRVQSDAITRLIDCYSAAKIYRLTHEQLLARKQEHVYDRLPKGTPRHVDAYIRGYDHALLGQTMRHDLIFGAWVGIEFYNHERGNPDSVDDRGIPYEMYDRMLREHNVTQDYYWRHDTTKPF